MSNTTQFAIDEARQSLLASMPVTERVIHCAGISTPVLEGGAGLPVILLHGPYGYAAHWMHVIRELAPSHRVIAPDLPGHGSSDASAVTLDADRVLSWLGELIEQCAESPPLLVGETLGGAIAARFAARAGDRIRGLVLVDTFGLGAFEPQPEFARALMTFAENPTEETHGILWKQCAFDLDAVQRRMGSSWKPFESYNVDRARTSTVSAAVHALMGIFGCPIPESALSAIRVPTSLVWGRHDRATNLQVAEAASRRHGWPLAVIDDSADDPPIERPEPLVQIIRREGA